MVELFANSGDPGQMPHSAASDLGLHCLPVTRLGVSSIQWSNWPSEFHLMAKDEKTSFAGLEIGNEHNWLYCVLQETRNVCCKTRCPHLYACRYKMPKLKGA